MYMQVHVDTCIYVYSTCAGLTTELATLGGADGRLLLLLALSPPLLRLLFLHLPLGVLLLQAQTLSL